MIVVFRGVPGSGKSTLARAIAPHFHAVILDKDVLRAALFPGDTLEYTTAQDDFVISLILEAARHHLQRRPERPVFLDGRVHSAIEQVELVRRFAQSIPTEFRVVECVCTRETALRRIEADLAGGTHLAKNRDVHLLDAQLAKWETLPYPVHRIDTDQELSRCVDDAIGLLNSAMPLPNYM